MNITEEIVNQVADQMAKDIDTLVLMSALGWNSFDFSEGTVYGQIPMAHSGHLKNGKSMRTRFVHSVLLETQLGLLYES
jgi:hypothetical protein